MAEDISRTTIVALAILTLAVSVVGSFIVVSELAVIEPRVDLPTPVGEARLEISGPQEPVIGFSSGEVGIQIIIPED